MTIDITRKFRWILALVLLVGCGADRSLLHDLDASTSAGNGGVGGVSGAGGVSGMAGIGACVGGQCACSPPLIADGDQCRDVSRDPNHCGAIDNQCRADQYCQSGRCACRPGLTANTDGSCVDLQSDPDNCGRLGNQCDASCANGTCVDACPDRLQRCDNACTDTDTDPRNCDECGKRCDTDEICVGGNCEDFRIPAGCNVCPCDACGQSSCCAYPGTNAAICLNADGCP